jgi:hypothetical protein
MVKGGACIAATVRGLWWCGLREGNNRRRLDRGCKVGGEPLGPLVDGDGSDEPIVYPTYIIYTYTIPIDMKEDNEPRGARAVNLHETKMSSEAE